jgi:Rieske Fe-S protein
MKGRRRFIGSVLTLVAFARSAWAQATNAAPIRYAALSHPVRIPLEAVALPWHPVPFVAEARLRAEHFGPASPEGRRVLISGILFRTETALSALCVTCPHEQCQVDLVTDDGRLSRMMDRPSSHPLFECGCHFSVFDAANEGARLSGETPRGLYRFRITGTARGIVEIGEIEAVALAEV